MMHSTEDGWPGPVMLPDVNVLVYAFRAQSPQHVLSRAWLEAALAATQPLALSDGVLVGTVRVLTHPRIFTRPETLEGAIAYADALRSHPNVLSLSGERRFWQIFRETCLSAAVRGNLASDAEHAALAMEHRCEFITFDRDFSRFLGLKWRSPS